MSRKITAIKVQKRNPNRVNIYLDNQFSFGLARIVAAWLYIGQELSKEKISSLQEEDSKEIAYQKALKYISYRQRSEDEVRKHLTKNNIPDETIDHIILRLKKANLLDDQIFAKNWVDNRIEFRPRSRRALAHELRQKGISQELIEETLEDLDEDRIAYLAGKKHSRKLSHLDWPEYRQKMYGFLVRRGFNYGTISNVITSLWEEIRSANTDKYIIDKNKKDIS